MNFKTLFYWLIVVVGSGIVLVAPFNLKGLAIGCVGLGMVAYAARPLIKGRYKNEH